MAGPSPLWSARRSGTFYQGGYGVDIGAASLLPTLLLVAGALSLPAGRWWPTRIVLTRLALGVAPAVAAAIYLLPAPSGAPVYTEVYYGPSETPQLFLGPPYPMPWISPSKTLLAVLGVALAVAVIVTWRRTRTRPAWALASGLVLTSVAYPLVWAAMRAELVTVPYWLYNGAYPLMLAGVPLVLALELMCRAGRGAAAAAR